MQQKDYSIADLIEIMRKLRTPVSGCPWDIEQTFETIAPYTIEEAYEVDEAVREGDMNALRDELGDLLFQTIFHSRIAEEKGAFDFDDVLASICDKMIRRHPHVFADADIASADAQTEAWEKQKEKERAVKARAKKEVPSALDGVTVGLPALLRAVKLQKRAARVGFDWPETMQVLDKLQEECGELVEAYSDSADKAHIQEEFGDLMFVMANLARHMKIDPEEALRDANTKFERRFRGVEKKLALRVKTTEQSDLTEMDRLWNEVKQGEQKQ